MAALISGTFDLYFFYNIVCQMTLVVTSMEFRNGL